MINKIEQLLNEIENFEPKTAADVEAFRINILGKKGELGALMEEFKGVPSEQKRELGQRLNHLKNVATERINSLKESIGAAAELNASKIDDMTRPGSMEQVGSRHPISIVKNEIVGIFARLGYTVADGPEIEDDWHVFSALNFPPEHPARDMQDTFFIEKNPDILLRTHTSSIQVRTMERQKPPIRVICPGKVYRQDDVDATHSPVFRQIEGLVIDKGVTFADLRAMIDTILKALYGEDTQTRFRPGFFPFTEPSAEVDATCSLCKGKGCPACKGAGMIEVLGCGMVNPRVLEMCGLDPEVYSGYAFGLGLDRLSNIKYGVTDIRLNYENDVRFLRQFR